MNFDRDAHSANRKPKAQSCEGCRQEVEAQHAAEIAAASWFRTMGIPAPRPVVTEPINWRNGSPAIRLTWQFGHCQYTAYYSRRRRSDSDITFYINADSIHSMQQEALRMIERSESAAIEAHRRRRRKIITISVVVPLLIPPLYLIGIIFYHIAEKGIEAARHNLLGLMCNLGMVGLILACLAMEGLFSPENWNNDDQ
jgi:hypothetical protein